jgi:hypothetical protein
MDQIQRESLINKAKEFFRESMIDSHINKACVTAGKLDNYNVNPFLFKYLANFLKGDDNPRSIAEALVYPRLLGSSITTIFGMRVQVMINELFQGFGSVVPGIDIEFIDSIDGRKKYCQVKSGPNTINKDDVKTVFDHFQYTRNLARTNNLNIGINDLIVGIVYGEPHEKSSHYKRINAQYPVFIGMEFWHRLTGKQDFYLDLIDAFGEVALEVDGRGKLEDAISALTIEIQAKYDH